MSSRTQRLALRSLRDAALLGLVVGAVVSWAVRKVGWA